MDGEGYFASLSLYNTSNEIYKIAKESSNIQIFEPVKRIISLKHKNYTNITIFDL